MRGRLPFHDRALRVGQSTSQGVRQVHSGKMLAAVDAGDPGRGPPLQGLGERTIAEVRPRLRGGDAELPHQHHPSLPLAEFRGPRQTGDAELPQSFKRRVLHCLRIGVANFRRLQQQGAESPFAPRAYRVLAIVPEYFGVIEDLRRKMSFEIRERDGSSEKDSRLAVRAVQFRRNDEF